MFSLGLSGVLCKNQHLKTSLVPKPHAHLTNLEVLCLFCKMLVKKINHPSPEMFGKKQKQSGHLLNSLGVSRQVAEDGAEDGAKPRLGNQTQYKK